MTEKNFSPLELNETISAEDEKLSDLDPQNIPVDGSTRIRKLFHDPFDSDIPSTFIVSISVPSLVKELITKSESKTKMESFL